MNKPQYQSKEEQQHYRRTNESLLFTHGAEDKVGVLFWHEFEFCLGSVKEALAFQASRTNGYLALMDIVSSSRQVLIESEQHIDSHPLVRLHNIV